MNKYIVYIAAVLLIAVTGCKAKKAVANEDTRTQTALPKEPLGEEGVLKNMEGLDGCKWMIVLNNSTKLQPTNLAAFSIALVDGQKVWVDYVDQPGVMSTCMAGKVVKIIKIEAR